MLLAKPHGPHSLALAALLASLPAAGYMVSLPDSALKRWSLLLLGGIAIVAMLLAAISAGAADAEAAALRARLAEREETIARLNEVVREDERIVEVLSAVNQSIKSELVTNAFHDGAVPG